MPIVLKASGLALGKGVLICNTLDDAKAGVAELMMDKKFGDAGSKIVIEEFMTGREVSVLAFADGKTYKLMSSSQDHKRAGDGDTGLNTGGMGTFSPVLFTQRKLTITAVSTFTRRLWMPWLRREDLSGAFCILA